MRILPSNIKKEVEDLIDAKSISLDLYDVLGQCTWGQNKFDNIKEVAKKFQYANSMSIFCLRIQNRRIQKMLQIRKRIPSNVLCVV